MRTLALVLVLVLAACSSPPPAPAAPPAPPPSTVATAAPASPPASPPSAVATAAPASPPASPPADRCTQVADHFEPWRQNEFWKDEISARPRLIADCRAHHWSPALLDCLMAANAPLELDDCVTIDDP